MSSCNAASTGRRCTTIHQQQAAAVQHYKKYITLGVQNFSTKSAFYFAFTYEVVAVQHQQAAAVHCGPTPAGCQPSTASNPAQHNSVVHSAWCLQRCV
jgi:hypothetical protein